MKIEQYFNEKSGIFTALAIFITFMILSEEKSLFLSLAGFFISFILLSYLLNESDKIDKFNVWGWLLYLGYNLLFIASLLYGINKYSPIIEGISLTILIAVAVGFYGFVSIKILVKQILKYS
jgi:hypothetical protein